jgi:PEP-CTERM motif
MCVIRITLAGCCLFAMASAVRGDIVTPVSVVASSEFAAANNIINGSGLQGAGPVEGRLHDNNENNMWQTFNLATGTSVGETAVFTLDQNYDLSSAIIWQYNGPNGFGDPEPDREVDSFGLAVSSDLVSPFSSLGVFNLSPSQNQLAGPPAGEPAQIFGLAGANNVRRVQLTILSVHGGVSDGSAGLSEVRFEGRIVPEPTAIALFGMGCLMLWTCRQRRAVTT